MCGVGSLIYDSGAVVDIKPAGCKQWDCDLCGPNRRARLELEAQLGRPDFFFTLTLRTRKGQTALQRRRIIGKKLPLLMRRIHRETGVKPEYYVTIEAHKSGEPHLHGLLRSAKITKNKLKRWWFKLTGSYMVDLKPITNAKKAAKYISKYMGKEPVKFGTFKRYWKSKNWKLPPKEGDPVQEPSSHKCSYDKRYPSEVATDYRKTGWWIVPGESKRDTITLLSPEAYKRSFSYLDGWKGG